jgi:homocysteine S-methyltransferase
MSSITSLLNHQHIAILDGATGTEIERRGYSINDTKLWSAKFVIHNPQVLKDIHFDYYNAGADICTTATYQASVKGLIDEGVSPSDTSSIFKAAADICADARDKFWTEYCNPASKDGSDNLANHPDFPSRHKPLVAYSCGAYGASLSDGSEFTGMSSLTPSGYLIDSL